MNTDLFWWGERPREPKVFCSVAARRQTAADRIQNGGALPRRRYARSINQDQDSGLLRRFHHALELPVSRDRCFEFGRNRRHGFQEAQQQTALDRVIDILRQRPARRQRRRRIQLGRHDADDVAPVIHQRPARIARLHRHADLKIARVIRRARPAWPKLLT